MSETETSSVTEAPVKIRRDDYVARCFLKAKMPEAAVPIYDALKRNPDAAKVAKDGHLNCAEQFLDQHKAFDAVWCYQQADTAPPRDKFIACGRALIVEEKFMEAYTAFKNVDAKEELLILADLVKDRDGQRLYVDALVAAGASDLLLDYARKMEEAKDYFRAVQAFSAARAKEELLRLGRRLVLEERLEAASRAFAEAEATDDFLELGKLHWLRGEINLTLYAFEQSGSIPDLIAVGSDCLRKGEFAWGKHFYRSANAPMPKDLLLACGEAAAKRGLFTVALAAFKEIGQTMTPEMALASGDEAMKIGRFDEAIEAYASVDARNRLLDLGNRVLAQGVSIQPALKAFRHIGSSDGLTRVAEFFLRRLKDPTPEDLKWANRLFAEAAAILIPYPEPTGV